VEAARALGIESTRQAAEVESIVSEVLRRFGLPEAVVRATLSRGEGPLGLSSAGYDRPMLSVIASPLRTYPAEAYRAGIRSAIVKTRKVPAACLDPGLKTGNYLPSVLARRELEARGMLEGVQLSVDGVVVSGTVSNVFLVVGDALWTPDLASGCLPGVTRQAVLAVADEVGVRARERRVEVTDLDKAREVFFTSTLMECLPVQGVEGREYECSRDSITSRVHRALHDVIQRETTAR
jgi:branched-chain amino acid aminotransferase